MIIRFMKIKTKYPIGKTKRFMRTYLNNVYVSQGPGLYNHT